MFQNISYKLETAGQTGLDILFGSPQTGLAKWAIALLMLGLFLAGLLFWGNFLNWTTNNFDFLDWHNQVGPYLIFLTKALRSGQLPLHGLSHYINPDRYLGRPDRPLSPEILLLYFLDPATYVLVDVWIFYGLGFVGLLLIRRRYHLSFISFLLLYLLFNFNGHIIAHIAVGHLVWTSYFLLPFFILLVLRMVEGERVGWGWQLSMMLTMLGINLQGGIHIAMYGLGFLLLIALFQPRFWPPVITAVFFTILASMIRILPLAIQYGGGTRFPFLGGYSSITDLLQAFIVLHDPPGNWEQDYYLGALGLAFLTYFGIFRTWLKTDGYRVLFLPMLVMFFFTLGSIYKPLFSSPLPFLDVEREPPRFLVIPLVFLITMGAIQFESLLNSWRREDWEKKIFILIGLALMGYDLIVQARVWRLANYGISKRATDVIQVSVSNHPDPPYIIAILVGLVFTMLTIILMVVLAVRESKNSRLNAGATQDA
jgi:hypothetical protein